MNKKSRKQVAEEAIGIGALSQLSRNRKINNLGWLGIYVGVVTLIGELIKIPIKAIYFTLAFIAKIFWIGFKYIFTMSVAISLALIQCSYKGIKMLNEKYKEKKQV